MKYVTKRPEPQSPFNSLIPKDNECPTCGSDCFGSVASRTTGFLFVKAQRKKSYSCWKCGTEWNTGWIDQD